MRDAKHEFALYSERVESLRAIAPGTQAVIHDKELAYRVDRILRLKSHDAFIVFNRVFHMNVRYISVQRDTITVLVEHVVDNTVYAPRITCGLPLLKRTALQEAVYGLVECGVSSIQLLTTEKVQRAWGGDKELARLRKIIIAAAEQSKYFAFPEIYAPQDFESFVRAHAHETMIFFDPQGSSIMDVQLRTANDLCVMVGPEGDVTEAERQILHNNNVNFIHLTPTVLRAQQAAIVGVGLIRTMVNT